ncbi:MAG TPA: hypothetical protein VJ302_29690 [Blastocatellia bacterium]|nr:hypothetical protein [Blastocatellia bacterium]
MKRCFVFSSVVGLGLILLATPKVKDSAILTLLNGNRNVVTAQTDCVPCIPSGNQQAIVQRLSERGYANLCPSATFTITNTITLAENQRIYTDTYPTDDSRAVLRLASANGLDGAPLTMALLVTGANVKIRNLIVDGNRPVLGHVRPGDFGGRSLIEVWGNNVLVEQVRAFEPRSWTTIYINEMDGGCTNARVVNNEVGPSGQPNGTWADGISLACRNSLVSGNTITDATDGAIVVFGAPGSTISNNTIKARRRALLGGINMVDYGPYDGDYSGTVVRDNKIVAETAQIKVAIAVGPQVWGWCDGPRNYGGTVQGNMLQGAFMGYGIAVSGVTGFSIQGNASSATHSGSPVAGCDGTVNNSPSAFLINHQDSAGAFQSEFVGGHVESLLGLGAPSPGPTWSPVPGDGMTTSGIAAATAPDGSIWLLHRGRDNQLYYSHPDFVNQSSGWGQIPGMSTDTKPALVFDNAGRLRAYARGLDSRIYRSTLQGGNWSAWNVVPGGGFTMSAPEAVLFNRQVHLIVRGFGEEMYYKADEDGVDPSWYEVPGAGVTPSGPTAAVSGSQLYIVHRGFDNRFYWGRVDGSWNNFSGWSPLDGLTDTEPTSAIDKDGGLVIYHRGLNSRIYGGTLRNGSWSGWSEVMPTNATMQGPDCARDGSAIRVFITTPDGLMWSSPIG